MIENSKKIVENKKGLKESRKKGQMFLITASILITVLLILAASVNISQPKLNRIYIESSIEDKIFENIKEEVNKSVIYSFYDNINENVLDFLKFVRNYAKGRGFIFSGIYLGIYYNNSNFVNISFINVWNEAINVTLKINSTNEQTDNFVINDGEIHNTIFNVTIEENYLLTILFNEYKEDINISTKNTTSSYTYFFDIRMISSLGTRREKYVNTILISS